MCTYYVKWSQYCKDYQKDSYNYKKTIESIDDKNILTTLKKNTQNVLNVEF
jgi:hypothetical protein